MRLRARALGMAVGIVWGVGLFVAAVLSLIYGLGQTIGIVSVFFPGYGRSFSGAFMGLIWGLIDGFILGAVVALLYNAFHKMLYKTDK